MKSRVKKSLAVAGVASGIALAGITGSGMVSAASDTSSTGSAANGSGGISSLVDKLASKFNLNKSEVQAVFDEDRSAREAERQQQVEERLTQAVTDGKITEEQKTKILAKLKEIKADMEANRDTMKDKTAEERKAEMDTKRTELETWANDNGIPVEYLRLGMGGPGGHGGPGGPGMEGGPRDDNSSSSDNSQSS